MIRRLALGTLTLCALAVPARADLTLCNRTSYQMEAAIGFERRATVATRGWFKVNPGQCRPVVEGTVDADLLYINARTPAIYGSAPTPQAGQADLCVREGAFDLADARGCPVREQLPFSSARPSEGEKGPTINLGEEAGYDTQQARLAGIQRLLVIAGYDATPIDGVDGGKTQNALARFLRDRKLPADAPLKDEFFDTLILAARNPQGPGFSWCNDTANAVMATLGSVEMGAIVTRGWYRVPAGQCVRPDLRNDTHKLFSYGEAIDAQGRTIKRGDGVLSWGGTVALCTRDGRFELADQKDCAARGLNTAGFAPIEMNGPSAIVRFKDQ